MLKQIWSMSTWIIKSFLDLRKEALRYILYTGFIAFVLMCVMIWGVWSFSGIAGDYLAQWVPWDWAHNSIMFSLIIGLAVLVGIWILFKYILLTILSPVLSIISEKAERKFRGFNAGKGFSVAGSAVRGVRINARNIIKEVLVSVVLLLLGLIPGIHIFAWILLFLIQFYFAGFGIMDFYLERHLTFSETLNEVYRHKWAAVTLGAVFTILMLVPFVGVVIAPYLCTMAATRYFLNSDNFDMQNRNVD